MATALQVPGRNPARWRRFTPGQRLARLTVELAIVAAVVASLRTIEVIP